jgi:4-hydroxy-3-polyprenylbenzoate decarboxylase
VHAVDAAGVHPLLLAIGSERYTPYLKQERRPAELITISNHILGTGQLSLAKYLFIAAKEDNASLDTHHVEAFFKHILERVDLQRDLHFHTQTSIDTLDYSGDGLNTGSKLVMAAAGNKRRELGNVPPADFNLPDGFADFHCALAGVLTLNAPRFINYEKANIEVENFAKHIDVSLSNEFPLIILCDDSKFTSENLNNWVWVTFTRSNPSHDIYGVESFQRNKHWACNGSLIIDARIKPHHAPVLELDEEVEKRVDQIISRIN